MSTDEQSTGGGLFLPKPTLAVSCFLVAFGVMYLSGLVLLRFQSGKEVVWYLVLNEWFMKGYVWQSATHIFLHTGLLHLFANALGLYFLGPTMEREIGRTRFVTLFFLSGIAGGVLWIVSSMGRGGPEQVRYCLGASGAVLGIMGAYAGLFPGRRFVILPFPIAVKAGTIALVIGVVSVVFMIIDVGNIAHAAHLGGLIGGYIYAVSVCRTPARPGPNIFRKLYEGLRWKWQMRRYNLKFSAEETPTEAETDRVLDKMLEKGYSSLTPRERRILERASGG